MKKEEYLQINIFDKLEAPKVPKKHVRGMPEDAMRNVIRVCSADTSFIGKRSYAMVMILFDTGVRRGEMADMKITDVFYDQGLIRVMGKGGKERIVVMGEEAQRALFNYLRLRRDDSEALWVDIHGKPISWQAITSAISRIAVRAELPKGIKHGTHVYRHTTGTNYMRNGGNLKCLQELMGHTNIKTTMKYVDALGSDIVIKDHAKASPIDRLLKNPKKFR